MSRPARTLTPVHVRDCADTTDTGYRAKRTCACARCIPSTKPRPTSDFAPLAPQPPTRAPPLICGASRILSRGPRCSTLSSSGCEPYRCVREPPHPPRVIRSFSPPFYRASLGSPSLPLSSLVSLFSARALSRLFFATLKLSVQIYAKMEF